MTSPADAATDPPTQSPRDFVREAVAEDLKSGRSQEVRTRFPPEPNGYLHIGHAKAICIDFDVADAFGGTTNLRFDDTNPAREEQAYIDGIQEDLAWLGYEWERTCHASDYFQQLYDWAVQLIESGDAYVDEQSAEQIRTRRGSLTEPGTPSPNRDRPARESLTMLAQMKAGDIPEGGAVLRAKIDMASPNLNLRDPVMYRVSHATHPRTGDAWKIYPTYDYAHGQSDALEQITHSLCSLEFEDHRPLYEWFIRKLELFPSRQIEFARLNLTGVVTSKRKLRELVEQGHADGWDDPRMPTLRGMRRRGYRPEAIVSFCRDIGVTKFTGTTDYALLEFHQRKVLNAIADRRMVVADPIELVIENWDSEGPGGTQHRPAVNNPEDDAAGERQVPMSGRLLIERSDFEPEPPKKFFRLAPGREVRLRWGYLVTCTGFDTDDTGRVTRVRCTMDPQSEGGNAPDGRKVKGTIHWVDADAAQTVELHLLDRMFRTDDPAEGEKDGRPWQDNLNPDSRVIVRARAEPSVLEAGVGEPLQFERNAYFVRDREPAADGTPVFLRTVTLRDSYKPKT